MSLLQLVPFGVLQCGSIWCIDKDLTIECGAACASEAVARTRMRIPSFLHLACGFHCEFTRAEP